MANREILFHPEAAEEYIEALVWYSQRSAELGTSFAQEIDRGIRLISEAPERFPKYGKKHRRFLVRTFPYSIFYQVLKEKIFIVAVAHNKRRPGYWKTHR